MIKKTLFISCLLSSILLSVEAQNDCYFNETKQSLIIGNSKIDIILDPGSGSVTGLLNKGSGTQYLRNDGSEIFRIVYSTWELHSAPADDPWSAGYGTIIKSTDQEIYSRNFEKTIEGAIFEVTYDCLHLERRTIDVSVRYTIEMKNADEEIKCRLYIQNKSQGIIREALFPYISGLNKFEALIMPNESGQKIPDPVDKLSDEMPVVSLEYPGRGSMQWFEYYSHETGLYMASYDQELNYTQMCFGRTDHSANTGMWMVKYPFSASGTTWESPVISVGIHAGDWHWGADRYRDWLEGWTQKADVPRKVKEMTGGLCEIDIKAMDGRVMNTYEDMITMAKQVRESPNSVAFMTAGWMYDGHDTYYPEYYPIPDLGGKNTLTEVIDSIHNYGVSITAYVNGRLCNIETETYKNHGKQWAILGKAAGLGVNSIEFFELQEHWNKLWDKAKNGGGWFSVMCPYVKGWQDHLVGEISRVIGEYHFDGVFLDQPGSYYGELCYNAQHGHSNPASAWGPGLLELFRRVREEMRRLDPDAILWTEGMNDAFGQYMDYYMDKNPLWLPMRIYPECETFAEMWRYTLPDYILVNDPQSYSYPPSHDEVYGLNYAFVMGIRGIFPGPDRGIDKPEKDGQEGTLRRAVVKRIEELWIKGGEYLFYGQFMDNIGLQVSDPAFFARIYKNTNGIAVPVWNTKSESETTEIRIDLDALKADKSGKWQVTSLDTNLPLPYQIHDRTLKVSLILPAHDIDVVIIKYR